MYQLMDFQLHMHGSRPFRRTWNGRGTDQGKILSEYMAGKQRIVDGATGFAQRIQLSARLSFTD